MSQDLPERPVDVLGEPWTAETIDLTDDDEGAVVATLIHRPATSGTGPARGAVLHVHGFADYFFQTDYAAWWVERGYDFYALDLRKYGRSLREHQTPNYVDDLVTYDEELDAAWDRITERDGHRRVVVSGHSTGGLTTPLWLDRRRPEELVGLIGNSPWLELQGPTLRRLVGTALVDRLGASRPKAVIGRDVAGLYGRALHREHAGEWDYDLAWKPLLSFGVYAGWLRAVRLGHAALHRGLGVPAPILVLSSDRSSQPRSEDDEDLRSTDVVLEVDQIRRWSTSLGAHVTCVAVPGAIHDVVLSRPAVRTRVYEELDRWCTAYVDLPHEGAATP